jgi:hypothetical protein
VGSHHIGILVAGVFNASIDASKIPDGFEYNGESESYLCAFDDDLTIDVGKEVTFVVDELHEAGGLISISGNMVADGTGPSREPSQPLAHLDMSHISYGEEGEGSTKKRKRETSSDVDNDVAAATIEEEEPVEITNGNISTDVSPVKEKKAKKQKKSKHDVE